MIEQKSFNGLKFNNLTIIDNAPSRRTPCGDLERRVVVKCECGNEKDLSWKSVKRGKTKSCGCISLEIKIDIVLNNTYNYWTILNEVSPYITPDGSKMRKVLAECICGNRKEVLLNTIRAGKIKSCGCMTEHKTGYQNVSVDSPIPEIPIDKINKRQMGYWKVIELISAKRNENREIIRTVKAQCKCGYVKEVLLDNLRASKQCSTCAMSEIKSKISEEDRILRTRLRGVY